MKYFDIVITNEAEPQLAARLGYERVLVAGKDIDILDNLHFNGRRKAIVRGRNVGTLMRAIKEQNVIGVMIDDNLTMGKVIAAAKENEKPIVVSTEGLNRRNYLERQKAIYRLRKLFRLLAKTRNEVILVTLAPDRHSLLSVGQMIEVAKFLGADEAKSRQMISTLGRYNVD
jgi:hypothetical protein